MNRRELRVVLLLNISCALFFWQTRLFEFVGWDDPESVYENVFLREGLSWQGVLYAFTSPVLNLWHPLTTLSHLLSVEVFGLWAGGHHLVNLLIHCLSACALFLALRRLTGREALSFGVALLFSIHPLQVESVAWVTGRKDVLSALFAHLCLWAYVCHQKIYLGKRDSRLWFSTSLLFFLLGLLSKPSLVLFPAVLIFTDLYLRYSGKPHDRGSLFQFLWKSSRQKLLFFLLSAAVGSMTYLLQTEREDLSILSGVGLPQRMIQIFSSLSSYMSRSFYPVDLAYFYPPLESIPWAQFIMGLVLFAALSFWTWRLRTKQPLLLWGWLYYLLNLLPVLGIVVIGESFAPDRYNYLPGTGFFIMILCTLSLLCGFAKKRLASSLYWLSFLIITLSMASVLIFLSHRQTKTWKNTKSLTQHAIKVTEGNYNAYNLLGTVYRDEKRLDEAIACFQKAAEIRNDHRYAHYNLGNIWEEKGSDSKAVEAYHQQIKHWPTHYEALNALGNLHMRKREFAQAEEAFSKLLKAHPSSPTAHAGLAAALFQQKKYREAAALYKRWLEIDPSAQEAKQNLELIKSMRL